MNAKINEEETKMLTLNGKISPEDLAMRLRTHIISFLTDYDENGYDRMSASEFSVTESSVLTVCWGLVTNTKILTSNIICIGEDDNGKGRIAVVAKVSHLNEDGTKTPLDVMPALKDIMSDDMDMAAGSLALMTKAIIGRIALDELIKA